MLAFVSLTLSPTLGRGVEAPEALEAPAVPPPPTPHEPVLGLSIERGEREEQFRVLDSGKPIFEGPFDACEAKLIEALKERHGTGKLNWNVPTLGGKQFWADVEIFCGWRIQESVLTGHYRLLDRGDVRRAWGKYEACRTALEEARVKQGLKPRSDHLVVVLHGLFRSKDSFGSMVRALEEAGYEVAALNYPSTRRDLSEHARQVSTVLDRARGCQTVSFVTHSLGGIVARQLLSLDAPWRKTIKLGRLVMIAPPSRGSEIAGDLQDWLPFQVLAGPAAQRLTPKQAENVPLPPKEIEFGIVAGGSANGKGYNPRLHGDDDGVVTVVSTQLPGAKDFLRIEALHSFIMNKPECVQGTLRFLKTGKFAE